MKKLLLALFVASFGLASSCKKDDPETNNNGGPLAKNIPGDWQVKAVEYSGSIPNQGYTFNGEGENVSGNFHFDSDTNTGNFDITFVAKVDIGLGQPLAVTVNEGQSGLWKANDTTQMVTMWSNDTITDWQVLTNEISKQVWKTKLELDFGGNFDSIPVDIRATMVR